MNRLVAASVWTTPTAAWSKIAFSQASFSRETARVSCKRR